MEVPSVGQSRGVFEIFVPGLFLFVNLTVFLCLLLFGDEQLRKLIAGKTSNIGLTLVVAIPFAYLLGMILRLGKADIPDQLSVGWLRLRRENRKAWSSGRFPYIGWLGTVCHDYLPPTVYEFYKETWKGQKRKRKANKQFLNFCKVLLSSVDSNVSAQIKMAEAQSRYIAEMFYALVISIGLVLVSLVVDLCGLRTAYPYLILVFLIYLVAILVILGSYRQLRIKEVETVLSATFCHRDFFRKSLLLEMKTSESESHSA